MTLALAPRGTAAGQELTVHAPAALARAAERVERIDRQQLAAALASAGLEAPPRVRVTLISEDDPRARASASWVIGRAFAPRDVVIFPERLSSYPYESIESVVRHEVVHLALSARAGGRPLPRWFHEGVAVSVESGWGFGDRLRLLIAMAREPGIDEVQRLFGSGAQRETTRAYLLAAVLVSDLRRRHGAAVPGMIAARVATGLPFRRAFALETGETPDGAAAHAWGKYQRWTVWILAAMSPSAVWVAILVLAALAFVARRRRRMRRRRQWEEEDQLLGEDGEL